MLYTKIKIGGEFRLFLVDTGSQVSLICLNDVPLISEIVADHSTQLKGITGGLCDELGTCVLNLDLGEDELITVKFYVIESLPSGNILGLNVLNLCEQKLMSGRKF